MSIYIIGFRDASFSRPVFKIILLVCLNALLQLSYAQPSSQAAQQGYNKYVDPGGRFSLDYPSAMTCDQVSADEVKFSHSAASLRIAIIVEPRQDKKPVDSRALIESFKQNLHKNATDSAILEEGSLPHIPEPQGYIVCTYKDKKGRKIMQLVQFYVSKDKMLQMIISDRPQGFFNVEKVIRHVHRSLKIMKPDLN